MSFRLRILGWLSLLGVCALPAFAADEKPAAVPTPAGLEFFEKKVRPILVNSCFTCHSAETKPAGNLRVDDINGLLTGGNSGPAVVRGKPGESLLLKRVNQKGKGKMPAEGDHLTPEQVATLTKWVADGAAWPEVRVPVGLGQAKKRYEKLRKEHWAWQPLTAPAVPAVKDTSWGSDPLDRFVLAALEAKGLKPVGDADRVTLLRRVTFDLTGLPPTPADVAAFVADASPRAYERVVDRLLSSPRFGERWGRHWLDVARFGESTGPSRNIPYPHAWRYRDYVLDAVNADVPFDRFLTEQIAGDLLKSADEKEGDRLLTATGFLALGVKDVNQRFKVRFDMDNVDEQIDVVTRSALALTVSCARCHDHKFDPVPTTDYYALAGIFTSTENRAGVRNKMGGGGLDYYNPAMLVRLSEKLPAPSPSEVAKLKARFEKTKSEWDAIRGTPEGLAKGPNGQPKQRPFRLAFEKAKAEYENAGNPANLALPTHGVGDALTPKDTQVRIRGEAERLGPVVPRGYLSAIDVPGAPPIDAKGSGRLQLAGWLVSAKNPLTPRVIANRVWGRLFDAGIVGTLDNFGVTGDKPSHPELLDHLATRLVSGGWSVKRLVRAVVLSRTYRLAAGDNPEAAAVDPANRLLWRHTPRRLDAEELRDAMLAASGRLDVSRPTGTAAMRLKMVEIRDNGPEAAAIHAAADKSVHRAVYLPLVRGLTPHDIEAFDPADQTLVSGKRDATTVASQALWLLNSPFVRRQALALGDALIARKNIDDAARVRVAYRSALAREATPAEVDRARAFLAEYEAAYAPPVPAVPKKITPKAGPKKPVPDNPDEIDQTGEDVVVESVTPRDAKSAAWLALAQALFASAEFRYIR